MGMEAELEEEETEVVDKNLQKSIIMQNDEEYLGSALPVTPLRICRFNSFRNNIWPMKSMAITIIF